MVPPKLQLEKVSSKDFLRHIFRPIHIISLAFGISYFSEKGTVWSRILNILYTLFVFIVFMGCFLYRISRVPPMLCQSDAVSHSVIGIQQILAIFVVAFIYYQVLFYKTQFHDLLKLISKTETAFSVLNINFSYTRFTYLILFEVIFVTILLYASFIFFAIYYKLPHFGIILLELFTSINPMLIIILNLMTFANLAWYICDRLQILRHFLIDVCAIDSLVANHSNEVWKVKLMQETPSGLYAEFKKIAQIYEQLFSMVNQLNDIFGFSNLASMGKTCTFSFSSLFFSRNWIHFFFHLVISEFLALFSISMTCHLFLLFKLLTESTNNMNDVQFDVLGTVVTV